MKTVLVDKNDQVINPGDLVLVKTKLRDYPGMVHHAIYKVEFDEIRGLTLTVQDLKIDTSINNQMIGTYILRINTNISIWRSDSRGDTVYCKLTIEGRTFVAIEPTTDIELYKESK